MEFRYFSADEARAELALRRADNRLHASVMEFLGNLPHGFPEGPFVAATTSFIATPNLWNLGIAKEAAHLGLPVVFYEYTSDKFTPYNGDKVSLLNVRTALAVDRNALQKILNAKHVRGEVIVKPYEFESANILVGNRENSRVIVFAHYDSIETGAMDNASGVAVTMQALLPHPETLTETLYIFSGNEELSFDYPTYWGRGFREFEKKYMDIIQGCEKICVVDALGNGKTIVSQDKNITHLAFPIKNIKKRSDKIFLLYGDLEKLMRIYHSKGDTVEFLEEKYLKEAVAMIVKFLL